MGLDELQNICNPFLLAISGSLCLQGVIYCRGKSLDGRLDDILIHAHAPEHFFSVMNPYIGCRFGGRASGNCMLLVNGKLIIDAKIPLDGIAHCVQTLAILLHGNGSADSLFLLEMAFRDMEYGIPVYIMLFKNPVDLHRGQLLVHMVGYALYQIAYLLLHLLGQIHTEILFQNISNTALSGLAVDTDHV